ncbi:MAG: ceramidase domain-containing protein [Cyanobium sp. M30B3]|nr:MAG: ceramidase domain-containing protein [Cyanobium sp. M30B3]
MAVLDLYCERLGPGLLAEPLNAITNGAFLVAAWRLANLARGDRGVLALAALALAIGVGSGLFHTFATGWALAADVLPILLFQLLFLLLYLRRQVGLGAAPAAGLCLAFLLACLAGRGFPGMLNGSLAYAPTLAVLALLAWHQLRQQHSELLLAATGLFSLSLLLRSVDNALCPLFPIGTHLFWHLLNAAVLVLSGRALLASQQNEVFIPAGRR